MKSKRDKLAEKKAKLKGKMAAKKAKLGKSAKVVAVLALALALVGCGADPRSRANQSELGDQTGTVTVHIAENSHSNSVYVVQRITAGDVGYQAADSSGSTETQSATPTWTFPISVDARYNDAIKSATDASKGVLESLMTASANKVLALMQSGKSGTVEVAKKDGTVATVECEDGQCSYCSDGACSTD